MVLISSCTLGDTHLQRPIARPAPQLLPPPPPVEDPMEYIAQFKLVRIDGVKPQLAKPSGFRKFVQKECTDIGVKGYVWRVPDVHGKILAVGKRAQMDSLLSFIRRLQTHGFIETFKPEAPEFAVLNETFDILPSSRRHVKTGGFSDRDLDDVVSTASADLPMLRGSPSPHSESHSQK